MQSVCFGWTAVLAASLLFVESGRLAAEDWPQFRGPNCTGISTSKQGLPATFSPKKNVLWSKELGEGIGSPAVVAGRVFTTAMSDLKGKEPKLIVSAFEAET